MIGPFSLQATNRWDAVTLLRLLSRHHAWTVQMGEERWVVAGRAETEDDGRLVEEIVRQWARDRGRPDLADTLVNEVTLSQLREPLQ